MARVWKSRISRRNVTYSMSIILAVLTFLTVLLKYKKRNGEDSL